MVDRSSDQGAVGAPGRGSLEDGHALAEVVLSALWGGGEGAQPGQKGKVTATIVRQFRGPKIIVFKKRVKKGYKKTQGHRQNLTEIKVKDISLS